MRYWARKDTEGKIITVESYSHNLDIEGAMEITKEEYDKFMVSLPVVEPEPVKDLDTRVSELEAKMAVLEKK